jgi:hypothetical protein
MGDFGRRILGRYCFYTKVEICAKKTEEVGRHSFYLRINNSGSLAMLAAIRRALSRGKD